MEPKAIAAAAAALLSAYYFRRTPSPLEDIFLALCEISGPGSGRGACAAPAPVPRVNIRKTRSLKKGPYRL